MKTLLMATAAVALAASTASAANFDINNGGELPLADISSGTVTIEDCTGGITADVLPGAYNADTDDWAVAGVNIASNAGPIAEQCSGFEVTVVLERAGELGTVTLPTVTVADTGDLLNVPTADAATMVTDVTHVAVLVDEPNV